MYGIDIAKQRIDEQDRQILQHVLKEEWKVKKCLILGSGEGRISVMLAVLGFEVVCVDIDDYSDFYNSVNKTFNFKKPIIFIQKDIQKLQKEDHGREFSLILGQRVFHYLPYDSHLALMNILPGYMSKKGFLYTAVSCVDSAMGDGYRPAHTNTEDRFGLLSPEMQKRFSLYVPVCLYAYKEYKKMMSQTYFKKVALYQTSFGNIKGIFKI